MTLLPSSASDDLLASPAMATSGPLYPSPDGTVDAAQVSQLLGYSVRRAQMLGMDSKMGGMSGDFQSLDVDLESGEKLALVLKKTKEDKLESSATLGLPREAFFYKELAPQMAGVVPKVWHAHGDMATGAKVILMERLSDMVPAGVFFGPGNPNNWGVDVEALAAAAGAPAARDVAAACLGMAARLHGMFWLKEEILQLSWLRGAAWYRGEGEESWLAAQGMASKAWETMAAEIESGISPLIWDAHLVACLKVAFGKVSWQRFQHDAKALSWTVVQGDCHPGNAMWPNKGDAGTCKPRLIDFEMVGVGSGAQDVGQFMISHMPPAERRGCERDVVGSYHRELLAALRARGLEAEAEAYGFDRCWHEYVAGGAGRWLWFVPYLASVHGCPPKVAQYFNDQTAEFLRDHFPDPSAVGQPRV